MEHYKFFKDKKCILDSTFNLYNSYALNYFNNHDAILSLEMSRKQVNHLNNIKTKYYNDSVWQNNQYASKTLLNK